MSELDRRQRSAIAALAIRLSTTWKSGDRRADAYIKIEPRQIPVDFVTLERGGRKRDKAAAPRLRFDKVVTRVTERLQASLDRFTPSGTTVLVTITAPVRVPSKTTAALESACRRLLSRGSTKRDEEYTIHGNHVRIRLLRTRLRRANPIHGFVHNRDSDPAQILDITGDLIDGIARQAQRRVRRRDDRWIVMTSPRDRSYLDAYRSIFSQLPVANSSAKTLIAFADGCIEMLTQADGVA